MKHSRNVYWYRLRNVFWIFLFQLYKQMKNSCALGRVHDQTETVISTGEGRSFLPIHCLSISSSSKTQAYDVWCRTLSFSCALSPLLCTAIERTNESRHTAKTATTLNKTKQNRKCIWSLFAVLLEPMRLLYQNLLSGCAQAPFCHSLYQFFF